MARKSTTIEENGVVYEQTTPVMAPILCKAFGALLVLEGILLILSSVIPGLLSIAAGAFLFFGVPKRIKPKRKFVSFSAQPCAGSPTFGKWNAKVHRGQPQIDRFERSDGQDIEMLEWIPETGFARLKGSSGDIYLTSLDYCACPDFEKRCRPCKHIYFLARKMGYTNDDFYKNN